MSDDTSLRPRPGESAKDTVERVTAASRSSYALTLHVRCVKPEHAAYVAKQLFTLQQLFKLEGTDVETNVSAERNRDGQERIYELLGAHLSEPGPFDG